MERIKLDDFRRMRQGLHCFELERSDALLLNPIHRYSDKKNRALLLFHGFTSTPAVFRLMLPFLSCYDAVICPTLPGHASSIHDFSQVKVNDWLTLAEEQGKALKNEFEVVDVLGFSLGGLLACHLSYSLGINHLYLLAPAFELHRPLKLLFPLVKFFNLLGFEELRCRGGDLYSDKYYEISYRKMPITTVIELFTLIKRAPLPNVRCATDLFLGQHDQVICSNRVAERLSAQSNINIHWLPNSAHIIPLEEDISVIIECMQKESE